MSDWEYENIPDMYFPDIGKMVRHQLGFVTSKRDEHPPFYPFNTFAQRENNCRMCHKQVWTVGWYFRFLHLACSTFLCADCHNFIWQDAINNTNVGKRGVVFHGIIVEKLGKEIIEMLERKALTN